jgi:DNA-binding GntR family transcriptional regulator
LRVCFASLNDDDFKNWDAILERMRIACEQRDCVALGEADVAFHRFLVDRAGEPALSKIWGTIVGQVRAYFLRYHLNYKDLMIVYREHAEIIETFRRGDMQASIEFLAGRIGDPASDGLFKDLLRVTNARRNVQSA